MQKFNNFLLLFLFKLHFHSSMEDNKQPETKANNENDQFQQVISSLPKERNWEGTHLHLYQNSWYPSIALKALLSFQKSFKPHPNDIVLASTPKSGTTWLKAIIFLIKNRTQFPLHQSPLLNSNPHDLIPIFEFDLYLKNPDPDLEPIPDPRLFATHVPYHSLPESITECSGCKIVYVCRNPLDQFISHWHFLNKIRGIWGPGSDPMTLDEAFELYCKGVHSFGPFWSHVLGYWKASRENSGKVLFLKYEDMKNDAVSCVRKVAEFLGFGFSVEEEERGVVEEICRICSFESLKNLEVNKSGKRPSGPPNDAYFRKGEVGDWSNHLSPSMARGINEVIRQKLEGSGLTFDLPNLSNKDD